MKTKTLGGTAYKIIINKWKVKNWKEISRKRADSAFSRRRSAVDCSRVRKRKIIHQRRRHF
jgi:hypothetical protein